MRWVWANAPLDPATATVEDVASAKRMHDLGRTVGAVLGILGAIIIFSIWNGLGDSKWVEYTTLPAVLIGGTALYRITYEFMVRFRP